jgi:hypothetical protein
MRDIAQSFSKASPLFETFRSVLASAGRDEIADELEPAIGAITEGAVHGEGTEPIWRHQAKQIEESAQRETQAALETFGTKRPNWKDHEPAMVALSKKLKPDPQA